MSNPNPFLNAIFEGDVSVRVSPNIAVNGPGNFYVEGKTFLQSTASDALRVTGGSVVEGNSSISGYLTVQSGKWQSSTGNDVVINAANDSVVLRNVEGQVAGQFESTTSDFTFFDLAGASSLNVHKADGAVRIAGNIEALADLTVAGDTIISGALTVMGTTTRIETEVTTITDNVLCVNYAPGMINDGGYAIKRYQAANDTGGGAVVNGSSPFYSGTVVAATATTITFDTNASDADDMYAGAWIRIDAGPGADQVRRIKSYNGSTHTATLYSSADEAAKATNPVEGRDFTVVPTTASTLSVYVGQYVISYWRESTNEYVLGASPIDPMANAIVSTLTVLDVRAGNLKLEKVLNVDEINGYTSNHGVTVSGVNVSNGALTGVTTINGALPPQSQILTLTDNSSTPVPLSTMRQRGVYLIIVNPTNGVAGSALFAASKVTGQVGSVNRLVMAPGDRGERLDIAWPANGTPTLYYSRLPTGGTGAPISYSVTIYT